MKSHVEASLLGLYLALLRDCEKAYPQLAKDWSRDHSRLLSIVNTRGISVFTLDLPAFGKHFLKCYTKGQLVPSGIPCMGTVRKEYPIPRLFKGLILRVFCKDGSLRPNVDLQAVHFLHQLFNTGKKWKGNCSDARIRDAVKDYFDIESVLPNPTLGWDCDELVPVRNLSVCDTLSGGNRTDPSRGQRDVQADLFPLEEKVAQDAITLGYIQLVADEIISRFRKFPWNDLRTKHGPGAVSVKPTSGSKYEFAHWPQKLENLFPHDLYGVTNSAEVLDIDYGRRFVNHEPPAKLISVPKTMKAPRLIAAEPIAHQWIQQGILRYLADEISAGNFAHCIDFKDQSLNGTMALVASSLGTHATIDLSAASDRVSCWLVERIFRSHPDLLMAMHSCRTRWVRNTVHSHFPEFLKLKKFAAMGSALTFPVQSIVFACIAVGSVLRSNNDPITYKSIDNACRQVRVFGDDIIIPSHAVGYVTKALTDLGLKINLDKTFSEGNFRESCGVDAVDGLDITPAYYLQGYVESKPESIASLVDCSNNLFRKGFWQAAQYVLSTIPRRILKDIPTVRVDSGAFGIISYSGPSIDRLKRRWNKDLHRFERKAYTLTTRVKSRPTEGRYHLHQFFTESPGPEFKFKTGVQVVTKAIARLGWVSEESLIIKL